MGAKTKTTTRETYRSSERHARVTGRIIASALAKWDDHAGECSPSDHPDARDARDCARGEHR